VADHWVIPSGAQDAEIARDLIAYASSREAQANLAQAVPMGPANRKAFELIPVRLASRLPTAPANVGDLVAVDSEWWAQNGVEADARFEQWLSTLPGATAP
jgi:putative spermidine/putrescine transport system substrate-binding protein